MFDILKFVLFAVGGVAIYGLATGLDLNILFDEATGKALPIAKEVISNIFGFIADSISK